jgi:hypothetical protein
MVYFQCKNVNLGKFWKVLLSNVGKFLWAFRLFYRHLVYLMAIWYILKSFWYIGHSFGKLNQDKSGNPALIWQARSAVDELSVDQSSQRRSGML